MTDPTTPPVDNALDVGLTGGVNAQESIESSSASTRRSSTVVDSAQRLAAPDRTSGSGPSND
ncbi:MAG TPA: hypothetical protein VHU82_07605 [Vicinamibacterales bacterium]|nr:hypothetical protein [Vicinamibacterales bacterium]